MIQVVAIVTVKPGLREQVLDAYRDNVAAVRAEDGCLSYEAVVDVSEDAPWFSKFGPDRFVVVEKWASLDALKAHAAAPHMKIYALKTKEWISERAITCSPICLGAGCRRCEVRIGRIPRTRHESRPACLLVTMRRCQRVATRY